jgi:hypothetical protein
MEGQPAPPPGQRVHPLPPGRFTAPGSALRPSLLNVIIGDVERGGADLSLDPDLVRLFETAEAGQVGADATGATRPRARTAPRLGRVLTLLVDEVQRCEQQTLERHLQLAGFEERVTLDTFD